MNCVIYEKLLFNFSIKSMYDSILFFTPRIKFPVGMTSGCIDSDNLKSF